MEYIPTPPTPPTHELIPLVMRSYGYFFIDTSHRRQPTPVRIALLIL
ncbi:MAG TPA: hypothetical protein VHZ51_13180 [Ktedonobacteraceae bacterium]|nr:hypothetical protein [Ktedonobacteraceae bacterium]